MYESIDNKSREWVHFTINNVSFIRFFPTVASLAINLAATCGNIHLELKISAVRGVPVSREYRIQMSILMWTLRPFIYVNFRVRIVIISIIREHRYCYDAMCVAFVRTCRCNEATSYNCSQSVRPWLLLIINILRV